MSDQAQTLRALKVERRAPKISGVTRVISFTSGKGGVGKTNTVVNMALALAQLNKRVLILDADLGLANVDVLLGVKPKYTIQEVLEGKRDISEIVISGPQGIDIIPSASGVEGLSLLDHSQKLLLLQSIENIAADYDYLLIDTAAGISADVMYFNSASNEVICIITDEPTSLTDAYALIKVLSSRYGEREISVIVNSVPDEKRARNSFFRLANAVERFLHVDLKYIGFIPADESVPEAIRAQEGLMQIYPSSSAALAIKALARKVDLEFLQHRVKGGMQFFFKQLLELNADGF